MKFKTNASRFGRRCVAYLRSPAGQTGLAGGIAGFSLLALCHPLLATFGTSLVAVTSLALALALGLEWGFRGQEMPAGEFPRMLQPASRNLLLALWVLLLPLMLDGTMLIAAQIPADVMAAPGRLLLFQLLACGALLSFPVFLIVRTPVLLFLSFAAQQNGTPAVETKAVVPNDSAQYARWHWRTLWSKRRFLPEGDWQATSTTAVVSRYLIGTAAGLFLGVLLLAPWLGIRGVAWVAASACFAYVAAAVVRWVLNDSKQTVDRVAAPINSCSTRPERFADSCWRGAAVVLLGALLAVVVRMVGQLAAAASFLVYVEWTAVLAGVAFGLSRRWLGSLNRVGVVFALAVWAAVVLGTYSWSTEASLLINAYISQPWLMTLLRVLVVSTILFPFGFAWGRLASPVQSAESATTEPDNEARSPEWNLPSLQTFALVSGYLSTRWVAFPRWAVADLLWASTWMLAGLVVFHCVKHRRIELPSGRWRRAALAGALAALVAVPFVRGQYDAVKTARQLFATNVFVARMRGLESEQLSFLDEGRNVARREGERGTLTVWRYRGNQLQIRESGVPKALVSTDPRVCPHFTAEVMQAVMPLALHESPRRVMVLGLGGGVPLTTSLAFPVLEVTCVESDQELLGLLKETVWSESNIQPFNDTRLKYLPIDPRMAVACRAGEYDVVISSPDHSALLQTTPYFTQGFYRGVSRQLAKDGIFCQRFHQVDYGPMPLQTAVKTLQSVFKNVVAVEIASGEMALLATNSEKGLSRDGLLTRFRSTHVRRALGEIGWDWAIPMNLTAFSHEGLQKFADATPNTMNTAANGRLAFRLPQEVMRWGPKWQELLTLIGPHGSRFAEARNIDATDPEFLRRLSEVTGQRKLMTAYPDQWWAYRKSLKKQIRDRPRTLIQKVSAETPTGRFHPEDRRRMRYFAALDLATKEPTPARVDRVAAFEQPYDPLLSYFVHQETAELIARAKHTNDREELRHRLHAIYFAHPHDRSVRNVAAALNLVARRPDATNSAAQRWDQLNSLMQVMKGRWALRGLVKPKSVQIVLNDIDDCLRSIDLAIETMDTIRADADVTPADWDARRSVLKRGLIGPLKTYRKNLLVHHLKEKHKLKKLLEKLDETPEDDAKPGSSESKDSARPVAN